MMVEIWTCTECTNKDQCWNCLECGKLFCAFCLDHHGCEEQHGQEKKVAQDH